MFTWNKNIYVFRNATLWVWSSDDWCHVTTSCTVLGLHSVEACWTVLCPIAVALRAAPGIIPFSLDHVDPHEKETAPKFEFTGPGNAGKHGSKWRWCIPDAPWLHFRPRDQNWRMRRRAAKGKGMRYSQKLSSDTRRDKTPGPSVGYLWNTWHFFIFSVFNARQFFLTWLENNFWPC